MPDVMVEVAGSWLGERRGAFLPAVHRAVAGSLGTPEDVGLRGGQAACDVDLGYAIQI